MLEINFSHYVSKPAIGILNEFNTDQTKNVRIMEKNDGYVIKIFDCNDLKLLLIYFIQKNPKKDPISDVQYFTNISFTKTDKSLYFKDIPFDTTNSLKVNNSKFCLLGFLEIKDNNQFDFREIGKYSDNLDFKHSIKLINE